MKTEKELEDFIKDKTRYSAPENWAYLVAQKLIDYGLVVLEPETKESREG